LHFGRVDGLVVEALGEELRSYDPHVVAVSGDLTQRAQDKQFAAARRFIDGLPAPSVVVPGNHDVAPFHAPVERLFQPFSRYRRGISSKLDACFVDDELLLVGLNTADPLQRKEGKVRRHQIDWMCSLAQAHPQAFGVLVSHHPIVGSVVSTQARAPWGSGPLLRALEDASIKLVLAGHLHETFAGTYAARIGADHSVLVVQASTATSTRLRGEPNAYNRITISWPEARVEVRVWNGKCFETRRASRFEWQGRTVQASPTLPPTVVSDTVSLPEPRPA
jgi:3',5'-cyclic AMP phosphodiesterase CpdA